MATTTSLYETGLLEYLAERYLEKGGKPVAFLPSGTGTALLSAKRGEADLLLVHAPPLERKFMEEGYGERRVAIAYTFFFILGPPGDPAGWSQDEEKVVGYRHLPLPVSLFHELPFQRRGMNE
ncbi:MAG: hypothetical protein DSO03_06440, partial [Hadesarchaea archaeon]